MGFKLVKGWGLALMDRPGNCVSQMPHVALISRHVTVKSSVSLGVRLTHPENYLKNTVAVEQVTTADMHIHLPESLLSFRHHDQDILFLKITFCKNLVNSTNTETAMPTPD